MEIAGDLETEAEKSKAKIEKTNELKTYLLNLLNILTTYDEIECKDCYRNSFEYAMLNIILGSNIKYLASGSEGSVFQLKGNLKGKIIKFISTFKEDGY